MTAPNPAQAYHDYLGPAMFVPMSRVMLVAAAPKPGERVLDVACGTGIVTTQLPALVGATGKVTGLDINPGMLAVARETPGIEWIEGNGMAMPFPDAAFDLVICQHGLQFFPDRGAGAREMKRVGGRCVIACWKILDDQTFFTTLIRSQARHTGAPETKLSAPFSFGDANALRQILLDAGFTHVEMQSHTIEVRFPQPEKFIRMTATAGAAVMPEAFARVDLDELVAKVTADCADDLAKYQHGDVLVFPLHTNLAIAH